MNRSMRTSASLIALSLALAGCSTSLFESKRIDYKSAKQMPQTLEIPPDLTAPTRDDRFADNQTALIDLQSGNGEARKTFRALRAATP